MNFSAERSLNSFDHVLLTGFIGLQAMPFEQSIPLLRREMFVPEILHE